MEKKLYDIAYKRVGGSVKHWSNVEDLSWFNELVSLALESFNDIEFIEVKLVKEARPGWNCDMGRKENAR